MRPKYVGPIQITVVTYGTIIWQWLRWQQRCYSVPPRPRQRRQWDGAPLRLQQYRHPHLGGGGRGFSQPPHHNGDGGQKTKRPRHDSDLCKTAEDAFRVLRDYPRTDQSDYGFKEFADLKLETKEDGNFDIDGFCPGHLHRPSGFQFFKDKNPCCTLAHSPVARQQILPVRNICPNWAEHGCEDYQEEMFEVQTEKDINGRSFTRRVAVGHKWIRVQDCHGS